MIGTRLHSKDAETAILTSLDSLSSLSSAGADRSASESDDFASMLWSLIESGGQKLPDDSADNGAATSPKSQNDARSQTPSIPKASSRIDLSADSTQPFTFVGGRQTAGSTYLTDHKNGTGSIKEFTIAESNSGSVATTTPTTRNPAASTFKELPLEATTSGDEHASSENAVPKRVSHNGAQSPVSSPKTPTSTLQSAIAITRSMMSSPKTSVSATEPSASTPQLSISAHNSSKSPTKSPAPSAKSSASSPKQSANTDATTPGNQYASPFEEPPTNIVRDADPDGPGSNGSSSGPTVFHTVNNLRSGSFNPSFPKSTFLPPAISSRNMKSEAAPTSDPRSFNQFGAYSKVQELAQTKQVSSDQGIFVHITSTEPDGGVSKEPSRASGAILGHHFESAQPTSVPSNRSGYVASASSALSNRTTTDLSGIQVDQKKSNSETATALRSLTNSQSHNSVESVASKNVARAAAVQNRSPEVYDLFQAPLDSTATQASPRRIQISEDRTNREVSAATIGPLTTAVVRATTANSREDAELTSDPTEGNQSLPSTQTPLSPRMLGESSHRVSSASSSHSISGLQTPNTDRPEQVFLAANSNLTQLPWRASVAENPKTSAQAEPPSANVSSQQQTGNDSRETVKGAANSRHSSSNVGIQIVESTSSELGSHNDATLATVAPKQEGNWTPTWSKSESTAALPSRLQTRQQVEKSAGKIVDGSASYRQGSSGIRRPGLDAVSYPFESHKNAGSSVAAITKQRVQSPTIAKSELAAARGEAMVDSDVVVDTAAVSSQAPAATIAGPRNDRKVDSSDSQTASLRQLVDTVSGDKNLEPANPHVQKSSLKVSVDTSHEQQTPFATGKTLDVASHRQTVGAASLFQSARSLDLTRDQSGSSGLNQRVKDFNLPPANGNALKSASAPSPLSAREVVTSRNDTSVLVEAPAVDVAAMENSFAEPQHLSSAPKTSAQRPFDAPSMRLAPSQKNSAVVESTIVSDVVPERSAKSAAVDVDLASASDAETTSRLPDPEVFDARIDLSSAPIVVTPTEVLSTAESRMTSRASETSTSTITSTTDSHSGSIIVTPNANEVAIAAADGRSAATTNENRQASPLPASSHEDTVSRPASPTAQGQSASSKSMDASPRDRLSMATTSSIEESLPTTPAYATPKLTDSLPTSATVLRQAPSNQQPSPSVATNGSHSADTSSRGPIIQSQAPRTIQDTPPTFEPGRTANLTIQLTDGQTTRAIIREREGSVDVKIVTSSSAAADRVSGEIDSMRQNFDAAGLRLGHSEVSYQHEGGGRGGQGRGEYQPQGQPQQSSNEIFTLSEVIE